MLCNVAACPIKSYVIVMSYIVIFQDFYFALAVLAMAFSKADVLRECVIIT